jgi:hypothetical protein
MSDSFSSQFGVQENPRAREEQLEALQCVLKTVVVYRSKLQMEVFELEEFHPSSQNRKDWLPGLDSN